MTSGDVGWTFPEAVCRRVTNLLSAYLGTRVRIIRAEPVTEGWSARYAAYPWVARCAVEGATGAAPPSVIVKMLRPGATRGGLERLQRERAALGFLATLGSTAGPRLLAADDGTGLLIMEDLGAGPALEDLLVGGDPVAAERGLVAFARALGRLHATTAAHAEAYYEARCRLGPVDPAFDRTSILGVPIERAWEQVRDIAADHLCLPPSGDVDTNIAELLRILSEPGPYLAFSNGDACPANCRLSDSDVRFLDFEDAAFRHALLDAAALRFPFPACGCWSRLPQQVSRGAEAAYREELARACPTVLNQGGYERGLAAACAAWTIVRLVRLPKLENADAPHPMGFSRRGQLLDAIDSTLDSARQSRSLPSFASWLTHVRDALRTRWPHVSSTQRAYPAFRTRISSAARA